MLVKTILALSLFFYLSPLHHQGIQHLIEAEIDCLAMNIYQEANNEPKLGKIAVGNVTMNRVKSNHYPRTVCGVITQTYKGACQFSWLCSGKLQRVSQEAYRDIRKLATKIYNGEIKDVTRGALFFHNPSVTPEWAKEEKMTVEIGNHKFYRK
jgi:spore germination cell wall hydrolase CwlJ-like protein